MDAHLIALPLQAGSAVRLERMSRRWTQKQLAEKAGVSERLVNALEAGDAKGIKARQAHGHLWRSGYAPLRAASL